MSDSENDTSYIDESESDDDITEVGDSDTNEEASDEEDDEASESEDDTSETVKSKPPKRPSASDDEDADTSPTKFAGASAKGKTMSRVETLNEKVRIVDRVDPSTIPRKRAYVPVETRSQKYYAIKPKYTHETCVNFVAELIARTALDNEIELSDALIRDFAKRFIITDTQLPMGSKKSVYPENKTYDEIVGLLPLDELRRKLYSNPV